MISQEGATIQSLYESIRNSNTAAALQTHPDNLGYFLVHQNVVLVRNNFHKHDNWYKQHPPI